MKKKLLIVNRVPFGYHTDTFQYSINLSDDFNISYLCFDLNLSRVESKGINLIYVKKSKFRLFRFVRFFRSVYSEIKLNDLIMFVYFPGCSIFRLLFASKKTILDIRTGSTSNWALKRFFRNSLTKIESLFFKNITIISESLARKIGIKKFHLLPLGADIQFSGVKSFKTMNLVYIGTIRRRMENSIKGFSLFRDKYSSSIRMCYTIVGTGNKKYVKRIISAINKYDKTEAIAYLGYLGKIEELQYIFKSHNIGVAFIPNTSYFQCQPPTKIFEYILSGMACIATNTQENKKLINQKNGVICDDTPESFYIGLKEIYKRLKKYNSTEIRNTLYEYRWSNIVNANLKPFLDSILKD